MTWAAGQFEAVRICPIPFAQVALDERWEKSGVKIRENKNAQCRC